MRQITKHTIPGFAVLIWGSIFSALWKPCLLWAQDPSTFSPEAKSAIKQYLSFYTGSDSSSNNNFGANLVAWIIFGSIGFVVFIYGKKQSLLKPLLIGLLLMVYPYFVSNTLALYIVGFVLCAALFLLRSE